MLIFVNINTQTTNMVEKDNQEVRTTVYLKRESYKKLKMIAVEEERTLKDVISSALEKYLVEHK